jgi:hypothetical protein
VEVVAVPPVEVVGVPPVEVVGVPPVEVVGVPPVEVVGVPPVEVVGAPPVAVVPPVPVERLPPVPGVGSDSPPLHAEGMREATNRTALSGRWDLLNIGLSSEAGASACVGSQWQ